MGKTRVHVVQGNEEFDAVVNHDNEWSIEQNIPFKQQWERFLALWARGNTRGIGYYACISTLWAKALIVRWPGSSIVEFIGPSDTAHLTREQLDRMEF